MAAGVEEVLLSVGKEDVPLDWSDDGQHILFRRLDSKTFYDLWALPLTGRKPFPLITTTLAEQQGAISPDGRWIAYTTNAGPSEAQLFITSFRGGGEPQRIGAGMQPRWRPDGRELFFIGPDLKLTALPFDNGKPTGSAQPLFRILSPETTAFDRAYDAFPGGQQFLLREAIDEERPHVVLVQGAFTGDGK